MEKIKELTHLKAEMAVRSLDDVIWRLIKRWRERTRS
jgi:hypothetical protein